MYVTKPATVAVIPARWDSQRLPGKVLADLGGRPMLWWVWELCQRADLTTVVATDSDRVAQAASSFGARVVRTGACASGTDRVAQVAPALDAQWILGVQADEPLLDPDVLRALAATLTATGADLVTPMCPAAPQDATDPHVVKCAADESGRAEWFARDRASPHRHLGVYGWRRESLARFAALPPHPEERAQRLEQLRALHAGMDVRLVSVPPQPAGVDTPADLAQVRAQLVSRRQSCTERSPG